MLGRLIKLVLSLAKHFILVLTLSLMVSLSLSTSLNLSCFPLFLLMTWQAQHILYDYKSLKADIVLMSSFYQCRMFHVLSLIYI